MILRTGGVTSVHVGFDVTLSVPIPESLTVLEYLDLRLGSAGGAFSMTSSGVTRRPDDMLLGSS